MKRLLTLALFAVLLLPAVAQELTVATYNIRNANKGDAERGNGWERRCPWVCGLIEFQGFDIFGSQEVLDGQLHDMLAQLPDYAYIGVGRDDGKAKGEYSPIFYKKERFRLLDEGHFWLSEVTDRPNKGWDAALPRICTWGHFPGQADQAPVLVLQPAYGSRRCPGARGERQTGRREDPRNVRPQGVRDPHGRFQRRPEQPHLYDLHRLGGIGRFV